jgi:hypothetical protein
LYLVRAFVRLRETLAAHRDPGQDGLFDHAIGAKK